MVTKSREVWEFGDFQTPSALCSTVCNVLGQIGASPQSILEPTCGRGSFLRAASAQFPNAKLIGLEINPQHLQHSRESLNQQIIAGTAEILEGDFFKYPWAKLLQDLPDSLLILGNPPWVTSAELGALASSNIPVKSNFQNERGIDSITGKSNFDISEWMLLRYLEWLKERGGCVAVLVKSVVARKILLQSWKANYPFKRTSMYSIDAMKNFGASVDACLFVAEIDQTAVSSYTCAMFDDLTAIEPTHRLGSEDGRLISSADDYKRWRHLGGQDQNYVWRSGIKHDCSKVMELTKRDGRFLNGLGEKVLLEEQFLYPMMKSSDVNKDQPRLNRFMLVTQRSVGEDTRQIRHTAPLTWTYLQQHSELLTRRASSIYRNRPAFSVFGIGDYSFAPWKVAISGFYKTLRFVAIGPTDNKPTVLDDTIYFLPCQSKSEAEFLTSLLNSQGTQEFFGSMVFWTDKRPVTSELLRRLDISAVAKELGVLEEYNRFAHRGKSEYGTQLSMFDATS